MLEGCTLVISRNVMMDIMWYFGFSLRIVNTTQLVSTAQNAGMASMATPEMGLRMIVKNVHVNHPRRPRESKFVFKLLFSGLLRTCTRLLSSTDLLQVPPTIVILHSTSPEYSLVATWSNDNIVTSSWPPCHCIRLNTILFSSDLCVMLPNGSAKCLNCSKGYEKNLECNRYKVKKYKWILGSVKKHGIPTCEFVDIC